MPGFRLSMLCRLTSMECEVQRTTVRQPPLQRGQATAAALASLAAAAYQLLCCWSIQLGSPPAGSQRSLQPRRNQLGGNGLAGML